MAVRVFRLILLQSSVKQNQCHPGVLLKLNWKLVYDKFCSKFFDRFFAMPYLKTDVQISSVGFYVVAERLALM